MNKRRIYVENENGSLVPTNTEYNLDTHQIMIGFDPPCPCSDSGCVVEWEGDKILKVSILPPRKA